MIEQLTDEERERIVNMYDADEPEAKALRIIDAHAAERAALVAQLAKLTRERDEAREAYKLECKASDIARAEVTRLTDELKAAEELKTALNTDCDRLLAAARHDRALLDAAEARVRELEAQLGTSDTIPRI